MGPAVSQTSAALESPLAAERQRLMRHAIVNNLAAPISAVVGILLVPVMLRALGQDSYSLWIIATSLAGIVAASDLGLGWGMCRVVAADPQGRGDDHVAFVRSAANIFALVGLGAGIVLGLTGLVAGHRLHLPPEALRAAPAVFWVVGASICAERLSAFGLAVLSGLRRFELINAVTGAASILWGAAALAVLINGGAVANVAVCLLGTALLKCGVTLFLVARLSPRYSFKPGSIRWLAVRHHVSFALSSLLVDVFGGLAWNCGPVLLGFIRGPAAAVPYYIAQKFPLAVSGMSWRAAEVVFPAAAQSQDDAVRSRDTLRVGSRWVLALALPFAVLLFVAAPNILQAWIGSRPTGTATILRILAAVVLLDAMAAGPLHVLWGRGAVKTILSAQAALGVGAVVLTATWTFPFGAAGAALGLLVPVGATAVVFIAAASRLCAIPTRRLMAETWRGLALPAGVCAASAALFLQFKRYDRAWVIVALVTSALVYLILLFGVSGNADEKSYARKALVRLKHLGSLAYRRVRRAASRVRPLRSTWYLGLALGDFMRDASRNPSYYEDFYRIPDPWHYETGDDRKRHLLAASMLERARPEGFRRALEIACAEGIFTEMLARRCDELVAVDYAPTALQRARQRVRDAHVRFERLDLRLDPIPGGFDLIAAMDVLSEIMRPAGLKQIRDRLIAGLRPGGYLLLTDPRQSPLFETEWWGRWLLRGGLNIRKFIGSHPALSVVSTDATETHVFGLFRKDERCMAAAGAPK